MGSLPLESVLAAPHPDAVDMQAGQAISIVKTKMEALGQVTLGRIQNRFTRIVSFLPREQECLADWPSK